MTTTNEIPAGALAIEPAERITRPNHGETIETRLGRLEAAIRHHNDAEQKWRKRTRDLDAQFEQSMGRLNTWADHVEECLRMVDSNREQNDNVHEIILRHLGVDMAPYGDPPRMDAHQIAHALGVDWPRQSRTAKDEPEPDAGEDDPYLTYEQEMKMWRHIEHVHYVTTPTQCENLKAAREEMFRLGLAVSPDDPWLQPLRPEPDLTLDVLRRLKDRDMHVIPPGWVSATIACTIEAINAQRGAAVYHDEQDG